MAGGWPAMVWTRARRSWLILYLLVLSGGVGLAVGAALRALWPPHAVRGMRRGGLAAGWAVLWGVAWRAATGHADWPAAFYRHLLALAAGGPLGAGALPAFAAGWGFWALVTWALGPAGVSRGPDPRVEGGDPLVVEPPPGVLASPALLPPDGVELGRDARGRPGVLTDGQANTHVLIVGATGSGKTNALLLILASALRRDQPLVVIDGKGSPSLRAHLQRAAAAAGRDLTVWSLRGPARYDPLRHGGPTELRDKLVATETWSEPHYRRAAERYLGVALDALRAAGQAPTLRAVCELLHVPRLEALGRRLPDEAHANRLYAYLDGLDASAKSAVAGLAHRLTNLVESEAGPWLEPGPPAEGSGTAPEAQGEVVDLRAVVVRRGAVLFSLDALRYPGLTAQVGALLLQDLKTVAADLLDAGHRGLWYLAVDEWSVLEGAHVLSLLNKGREAGLCCVLATQDLADIAAAGGPALVDQVLANTNVKLALRQDADASARRLAATLGARVAWEGSYRLRHGAPTGDSSMRAAERPVLSPDLLKRLPPYQAVLWRKAPDVTVQRLRLRRAGDGGSDRGRAPAG